MAVLVSACGEALPTPFPTATPEGLPAASVLPQPARTATAGATLTAYAEGPGGVLWYGVDRFDDMGGLPQGAEPRGLFRYEDGRVTRIILDGAVRVIETGPDGAIYVGAGCGVVRIEQGEPVTLAEVDCDRSRFESAIFPFDLAFGADGSLWVAGVHALAHYAGDEWTEYPIRARRVLVAPDGSVWTGGWDGVAGSDCCITHVSGGEWTTYSHGAGLPVESALAEEIRALVE